MVAHLYKSIANQSFENGKINIFMSYGHVHGSLKCNLLIEKVIEKVMKHYFLSSKIL